MTHEASSPIAPPSAPLVEVIGYWLSLDGKEILRDVSFSLERGEHLAVVGPNGAGKTTLLKALMCIVGGVAVRGTIRVAGRALRQYRQRDLARRLSYVPQAASSDCEFTVEQFVLMGRYPHFGPLGSIDRTDRVAVAEALRRTGLAPLAGRRLDTLSGGERQKVYIAAALAQGADVLLLDEPTTFLDYRHQLEIRRVLAELRRGGATIIAATHDLGAAALDCDRVLALSEGRVVFHGPPGELLRPERLEALYGVPFVLVEHPRAGVPVVVPCPTELS